MMRRRPARPNAYEALARCEIDLVQDERRRWSADKYAKPPSWPPDVGNHLAHTLQRIIIGTDPYTYREIAWPREYGTVAADLDRWREEQHRLPKDAHPCLRLAAVSRIQALIFTIEYWQARLGRKKARELRLRAHELSSEVWRQLADQDIGFRSELSKSLVDYAAIAHTFDRTRALRCLEDAAFGDLVASTYRGDGPSHRNLTITQLYQAVQLEACGDIHAARNIARDAVQESEWLRDNSPAHLGDLEAASTTIRSSLGPGKTRTMSGGAPVSALVVSLRSRAGRSRMLRESAGKLSPARLMHLHNAAIAAYQGALSGLSQKVETLSESRKNQMQAWLAVRFHELSQLHSSAAGLQHLFACYHWSQKDHGRFPGADFDVQLDHAPHFSQAVESSKKAVDLLAPLYEMDKSTYATLYLLALCQHTACIDAHQKKLTYAEEDRAVKMQRTEEGVAARVRAHSVALDLWRSEDSDEHRFVLALTALAVAADYDHERSSWYQKGRAAAHAAAKHAFDAQVYLASISKSWPEFPVLKGTIEGGLLMSTRILNTY